MKNQSLINLVLSSPLLWWSPRPLPTPSRSHSISQANVTKQFIVAPATIVKAFPCPAPPLLRPLATSLLKVPIRGANECGTFLSDRRSRGRSLCRSASRPVDRCASALSLRCPPPQTGRQAARRRRVCALAAEDEEGGEERRAGGERERRGSRLLPHVTVLWRRRGLAPSPATLILSPLSFCMTTDGRRRRGGAGCDHCARRACVLGFVRGENIPVIGRDLRKRHLPEISSPLELETYGGDGELPLPGGRIIPAATIIPIFCDIEDAPSNVHRVIE